jgi:hypothetical protein
MFRCRTAFALSLLVALPPISAALAQESGDLAKAAQNPVAAMISLPFQNNTLFGVGPGDDTANVLNIQPVIPFTVGDWNIVNRTIVPLIYLPDVTSGLPELPEGVSGGETFGLGDINHSVYFSPADSGPVIWGVGPSLTIPDRHRQEARHPEMEHRAGSGGARAAGAVGGRQPGPPAVVVRRRRRPPGRQPAADPAVRQLQHGGRLVSGVLADRHGELGGRQRQHLDGAGRRRLRQDFQDRQPADQRPAPGLPQRRAPGVRPGVGHALPAPVPVPK